MEGMGHWSKGLSAYKLRMRAIRVDAVAGPLKGYVLQGWEIGMIIESRAIEMIMIARLR